MKLTYCSFADKTCNGVVLLPGEHDPIAAASMCHILGINPGGELLAIPADTAHAPPHLVAVFEDTNNHNRLFTKDEAVALFEAKRLGDLDREQN